MTQRVRTVHHLDDEPEFVKWIPQFLRDRIYLTHRSWSVSEVVPGDHTATFEISGPEGGTRVDYRIYTTLDAFLTDFVPAAAKDDFVFLDAMIDDQGQELLPEGAKAYPVAAEHVGEDRAWFVTAFPFELLNLGGKVRRDRILTKPVDGTALANRLMQWLGIGEGGPR